MDLAVEWKRPVPLKRARGRSFGFEVNEARFLPEAGIYIFARRWGSSFEALYIGKTAKISRRIRQHLNNLRLVRHLSEARSGRRVVIVGYPVTKGGQQMSKVLDIVERSLIRHFLSEGHDLANKQGARIRRHAIRSSGPVPRAFVPANMFLEKR